MFDFEDDDFGCSSKGYFDIAEFHNEIDEQINLQTQNEDNGKYKNLRYDHTEGFWWICGNGKAFDDCLSDGEAMARLDNN